ESLSRKLEAMEIELGRAEASPLEKLLIARITACWLQTQHADAACAQLKSANVTANTLALKRQDSAQRRMLAAIKQLPLVRKLLKPALSPVDLALKVVPESGRKHSHSARHSEVETVRN